MNKWQSRYFKGCIICAGFWLATAAWSSAEELQSINLVENYKSCVKVYDGGYANSQRVIRFYNGCATDLYMNACVVATSGEVKLYQAPRRIPRNGNWSLYTFPDITPRKIAWNASAFGPPDPNICGKA